MMSYREIGAVRRALHVLGMGECGTVPLSALSLASDEVLMTLAASAPTVSMPLIVALACGPLSHAAYASIWYGRTELLAHIERIKLNAPGMFRRELSLAELTGLTSGSFNFLTHLVTADPATAEQAMMLWDPARLAQELTFAAAGHTFQELLSRGPLSTARQVALAGLLLLHPHHSLAVPAMYAIAEPWRAAVAFLADDVLV